MSSLHRMALNRGPSAPRCPGCCSREAWSRAQTAALSSPRWRPSEALDRREGAQGRSQITGSGDTAGSLPWCGPRCICPGVSWTVTKVRTR